MWASSYDLQGNKSKTGNTFIDHLNGFKSVRLHNTHIVVWNEQYIQLNTNGWETITTKKAMNRFFALKGLTGYIFQRNFQWYLAYNGITVPYQDKMVIDVTHNVIIYHCNTKVVLTNSEIAKYCLKSLNLDYNKKLVG